MDMLKDLVAERDAAYAEAHRLSRELWEQAADSGLGVSDLARVLGVSRGTIYGWYRQREASGQED